MAKRANVETPNKPTDGRDLDELYKAHQIHTLAQMLYCQLTSGAAGGPRWVGSPNPPASWSANSAHPMGGVPTAGPVNAYWYA